MGHLLLKSAPTTGYKNQREDQAASIATTPRSASTSSKTSVAFAGKNAKGRTTRPSFSEYPASLLPGGDFAFKLQIALSIRALIVQFVKT